VSRHSSRPECPHGGSPLVNLVADDALEVGRKELFRTLGYPARKIPVGSIAEVCEQQSARTLELAQPWGSWREIPVEKIEDGQVRLAGGRELGSKRLAKILRKADAVLLLLVTLGDAFSTEVRRLSAEGAMLEAMVLDAAGTVATNALMKRLRKLGSSQAVERGYGATIRYGPGYTGWDIRDMAVLFNYLDPEEVPVRLNPQMMMIPEKSLIALVGLTPNGKVAQEPVPCRICDLENCSVRREPYRNAK